MRADAAREDIENLILDAAHRPLAVRGYKRMTMDGCVLFTVSRMALLLSFPP